MRIGEIVKLLATPFPIQEKFLGKLPEDMTTVEEHSQSDVRRMVTLYVDSLAPNEGEGGSEGTESWRARTQFPLNVALPINWQWLTIAINMLTKVNEPFLYTRHGLRSAHEWRLIRHLAGNVCDAMEWSRELTYPDFESLWRELGNDLLDSGNY